MTLTWAVLLMLGIPRAWGEVSANSQSQHVGIRMVAEADSARAGSTLHAGVYFKIEPGWHLYWLNAGDSGTAPKIQWELPPGYEAGELEWPQPSRLIAGPLVNYGYEKELLLAALIHVPADAKTTAQLVAHVKWLVCKDVCIPGKADASLSVPISNAEAVLSPKLSPKPSKDAPLFEKTRAQIPTAMPAEWDARAFDEGDEIVLHITRQGGGAGESVSKSAFKGAPEFFPRDSEIISNSAVQKHELGHELGRDMTTLRLKKAEQSKPVARLRGVVVIGQKAWEISAPFPTASVSASASDQSIWIVLFFALLGGLILNLMPCVFPVLSIKALGLLSLSAKESRAARKHGWAYTLGILASFWSFAILILAFRSGGTALGWGFQLQSPAFVGLLIELLFLIALNLLGVFEVIASWAGAGAAMTLEPGLSGSFFTGVLATVVATPCTAPFMGTALGYAMSQPAPLALAIFTALGLGLALPYLLLSYWPSLSKKLPKPGRWMESFRQFLAFPILGTMIWLLWVHSLQAGSEGQVLILSGLLAVGLGSWAIGRWQGWGGKGVFSVSMAAAVALALCAHTQTATIQQEGEWQTFTRSRLNEALMLHRPVFVDFTAAWCVSCKVNEKIALGSDGLAMRKMRERGVLLLKGDWTNADPSITEELARFGRNGVPLYLFYTGKMEDDPPHILPQLLTEGAVLKELKGLD